MNLVIIYNGKYFINKTYEEIYDYLFNVTLNNSLEADYHKIKNVLPMHCIIYNN